MFCQNCGKEINDGQKFCPHCGAACSVEQKIVNAANEAFRATEQELNSAINDVRQSFSGNNYNQGMPNGQGAPNGQGMPNGQGAPNGQGIPNGQWMPNGQGAPDYQGQRLKDDRGLVSYILLSIITCGIYSYYFIYQMAHDVNIACEGDGETTSGLAAFILLSLVTCGIYAWYWYYKLGNRLAANAPRYGMNFQENGTTVLMWCLFGSLLCGIGPFIGMNILIKNSNMICNAYNRQYGL